MSEIPAISAILIIPAVSAMSAISAIMPAVSAMSAVSASVPYVRAVGNNGNVMFQRWRESLLKRKKKPYSYLSSKPLIIWSATWQKSK